jgi:deazaflavin-dependent oxidoreductase (nitroreductase family)
VPLPRWLTRINRRLANRLVLVVAPRMPPYAVLHHVGRKTGRLYRTPVMAFRSPRGVVVPLFYGLKVEWLRNVLLAGTVHLVRRGWRYRLEDLDIRSGEAALGLVPRWARPGLRLVGVHHVLEGRIAGSGRVTRDAAEA